MTTRVWNNQDPNSTDFVFDGDDAIKRWKEDLQERMEVDHIFGDSVTDGAGQDGVHKKLTMSPLDQTLLQTFDDSYIIHTASNGRLCFRKENDDSYEITEATRMRNVSGQSYLFYNQGTKEYITLVSELLNNGGGYSFTYEWVWVGVSGYTKSYFIPIWSKLDGTMSSSTITTTGLYDVLFTTRTQKGPFGGENYSLSISDPFPESEAIKQINYAIYKNSTLLKETRVCIDSVFTNFPSVRYIGNFVAGDVISARIIAFPQVGYSGSLSLFHGGSAPQTLKIMRLR